MPVMKAASPRAALRFPFPAPFLVAYSPLHTLNADQEVAQADHSQMRLFAVERNTALNPVDLLKGRWQPCTSETVKTAGPWYGFSAVGYFFGRDLQGSINVPVGLIQDCWGGTLAEAWTSADGLKAIGPDFVPQLEATAQVSKSVDDGTYNQQKIMEDWNTQAGAVPDAAEPTFDATTWKTMHGLPHRWSAQDDPDLANNFVGAVKFRKEIDLSPESLDKGGELDLGILNDEDITWINGTKVGGERGWIPRKYQVLAGLLKPGRNVIEIWLLNTPGSGGMMGRPEDLSLKIDGESAVPLVGDWQYKVLMPLEKMPPRLYAIVGHNDWPASIYNGMIAPLLPFGIKGAIWYQGEQNADRAAQYKRLLPAMISDWRQRWNEGDFPFLIVQLAGFNDNSQWPWLRDAQAYTANHVSKAGLVTAVDIGDPTDIHPKNKQEVGRRLALLAEAQVYHQDVPYSGPVYKSVRIDGSAVHISFDHSGGLNAKGGPDLKGFTLAGADRVYYAAEGKIDADEVLLTSPQVPQPVAVRYDWAGGPNGNLYNQVDLPAFPFRSDDWPQDQ